MEQIFNTLRDRFGSHRKAAKALEVSYSRYNEWRWRPDEIPAMAKNYLKLAAQKIAMEEAMGIEHKPQEITVIKGPERRII